MDSIEYYDKYAAVYFESTVDINMQDLLDKFIEYLPENADVLDLGCGSGRDTLYLSEAGFYVTPLDGSKEMCQLAEIHTGKEVLNITFEELDFNEVFDGIWACASLLHVEEEQMDAIMKKVLLALKPGGILYVSYKYGDTQEFRNKRFFHDYNKRTLRELLQRQSGITLLNIWCTEDRRSNYEGEDWIHALIHKNSEGNERIMKEAATYSEHNSVVKDKIGGLKDE